MQNLPGRWAIKQLQTPAVICDRRSLGHWVARRNNRTLHQETTRTKSDAVNEVQSLKLATLPSSGSTHPFFRLVHHYYLFENRSKHQSHDLSPSIRLSRTRTDCPVMRLSINSFTVHFQAHLFDFHFHFSTSMGRGRSLLGEHIYPVGVLYYGNNIYTRSSAAALSSSSQGLKLSGSPHYHHHFGGNQWEEEFVCILFFFFFTTTDDMRFDRYCHRL